MFISARGVDLNTAVGAHEQCSNVLDNVQMCPLIYPYYFLFLKKPMELITTLGLRNDSYIFKEEK
jgi:hypothetical protein